MVGRIKSDIMYADILMKVTSDPKLMDLGENGSFVGSRSRCPSSIALDASNLATGDYDRPKWYRKYVGEGHMFRKCEVEPECVL